jgi:hypothetical protein
VTEILIGLGSAAMLVAGIWMIIWPDAAVRLLPEFREDATPSQARWNARFAGAVFVLFGWAGLYLVLVEGLQPFPPGDGPLGF